MSERRWEASEDGWSVQTTSYTLLEDGRPLLCVDPEGEDRWSVELFEHRHEVGAIEFAGSLDQAQDFACHVLAWYEQHGEGL